MNTTFCYQFRWKSVTQSFFQSFSSQSWDLIRFDLEFKFGFFHTEISTNTTSFPIQQTSYIEGFVDGIKLSFDDEIIIDNPEQICIILVRNFHPEFIKPYIPQEKLYLFPNKIQDEEEDHIEDTKKTDLLTEENKMIQNICSGKNFSSKTPQTISKKWIDIVHISNYGKTNEKWIPFHFYVCDLCGEQNTHFKQQCENNTNNVLQGVDLSHRRALKAFKTIFGVPQQHLRIATEEDFQNQNIEIFISIDGKFVVYSKPINDIPNNISSSELEEENWDKQAEKLCQNIDNKRYKNKNIIRKNTVCMYWIRGLCTKGYDCEYLHIYDESKIQRCHFWEKNACKNEDCTFRHIDGIGSMKTLKEIKILQQSKKIDIILHSKHPNWYQYIFK